MITKFDHVPSRLTPFSHPFLARIGIVQDEYIKHPMWPRPEQLSMSEDPALLCLSQWAMLTTEYLLKLNQSVGPAEPIASLYKGDLVEAVIAVAPARAQLTSTGPSGAQPVPLAQGLTTLARLIAIDSRVYADVQKLDGVLQVVQCYQFYTRVFFTAYNPQLSRWDYCFTEIDQIGRLLEPNFTDIDNFIVKYPPTSLSQLYQQLVKLLKHRR